MKTYNLVYKGNKLNERPLTEKEADEAISLIVMNYGYKPKKAEILSVT